ncbi:FAD-binding-domain-containing protein [Aspergillus terreus]|uniref:FAD-binding-domain-containing protein n=1 Tax=Aspergillus terreus TaxID=33178 RepID=A0A5M3Z7T2_ASPTE|nr:hypothetical protein ATETN484_0008056000 [Aspergillus terreus]GFF21388.1 FAD-binding-domain-containing protein [Aspergillus terreus]
MNVAILLSLAVLASQAFGAASPDTIAVCQHLHTTYPDIVVWDPLSSYGAESILHAQDYSHAIHHYWNGVNAKNRPICVFFPSNAEEVSFAVQQLNKYPTAQFALKSGGHNFNTGVSSTDGGVLISFNENLSSINRTSDGNFDVGPGARWGDVYEVAEQTNQVVVGGRLANIGVAGFTLGGGLSYYSAQYGLACDNVLNFEIVLSNGTIVNANNHTHTDLWWALKGGGNRFGIVTKFTFRGHPLGVDGQVWGGIKFYSGDKRHELFKALANFIKDYPDGKAAVIPTFTFGLPDAIVSNPALFFFYDGPSPPSGTFSGLEDVEAILDTTDTTTYTSLANQAGGAKIYGINAAAHVNTFPNMSPDQMDELLELHWETYQSQIRNDSARSIDIQIGTFTPQPLSVRIAKASAASGANALGLDPENGDRFWVENDLIWVNPICDEACPQYLREVAEGVRSKFDAQFSSVTPTNYQSGDVEYISGNPLFMNDAGDYQDVYSSYGTANKEKLEQIAKAYDPDRFMFRQGGWNF